jgi:hypothetical protein
MLDLAGQHGLFGPNVFAVFSKLDYTPEEVQQPTSINVFYTWRILGNSKICIALTMNFPQ